MVKFRLILLTAVLMVTMLAPLSAAAADSSYTVQAGDTLTSIAARYNTSVDALVSANKLSSANSIFAGQSLTIPGAASSQPASNPASSVSTASGGSYTVQAGDTLSGIALHYGTTVEAIMQASGLTDRSFIYVGQTLTIPGGASSPSSTTPAATATVSAPAPTAAAPTATTQPATSQPATTADTTYTVQAGDYLSAIANKFGVSTSALAAANNLSNPNLLFSGMVLKIPAANTAAAAPTAPTAPILTPTSLPTVAPGGPTATTAPANTGPGNAEANLPSKNPDEGVKPSTPVAGETVEYVVQAGDMLYQIAATYGTTVDAIVAKNNLANANVISNGQKLQIVVGDMTSKPAVSNPNEPAKGTGDEALVADTTGHTGKWVDVNVSTQSLVAYEGNTPVYSAIVSTGVAAHPTVIGTFKVYAKYLFDDMTGGEGAEYYYLPNVPHVLYFYGGYALHGTYWHTNFGHPMSHGCVNLSPTDATWIYNWAPIGTEVVTHW